MKILVGHTGFVGSTLKREFSYDLLFNSSNMDGLANLPDGCEIHLACLPAKKWVADANNSDDLSVVTSIFSKIIGRRYATVCLISTIDVYCHSPAGADEDHAPGFQFAGYGHNRRLFELLCSTLSCERLIVARLPALFGRGLRKNLLYDLMKGHRVEFVNRNSRYQWYDMEDLGADISEILKSTQQSRTVNLFPEPIETREMMERVFGFVCGSEGARLDYDFRTKHSASGYIRGRDEMLEKLRRFVASNSF